MGQALEHLDPRPVDARKVLPETASPGPGARQAELTDPASPINGGALGDGRDPSELADIAYAFLVSPSLSRPSDTRF